MDLLKVVSPHTAIEADGVRIDQPGADLVENPPLAQALYKSAEVGSEISPNLYRAVAEILAYIYRLSRGAS